MISPSLLAERDAMAARIAELEVALRRIVANCDTEDRAKYKNVMFYDLLRLIARAALAGKPDTGGTP